MKAISKIKNNTIVWNQYLRPRVGDVVIYNGNYFQNTSGFNSVPQNNNLSGWVYVGSENPIFQSNLKIISKGFGNSSQIIEERDIVCGMLDDLVTFIPFGKYKGDINGNRTQNIENYSTNPIEF